MSIYIVSQKYLIRDLILECVGMHSDSTTNLICLFSLGQIQSFCGWCEFGQSLLEIEIPEFYSLSDLENFIIVVEAGLSQTVEEGNYIRLVEVMGHLLAVKERQDATNTMFEPLQHTIALLKVYEQELPDVVYEQLKVNCHSSTSHSFPLPSFLQMRQTHYFFFVSYNCPSTLYPPAAGNSSSVTSVCFAFPSLHSPYLYI